MGIRSSNFLVNRGDQQFRCPATELKEKLRQDDTLLLERDGLQYGFKLPLNLDVISSVSTVTVDLNYEQYAYIRDRNTELRLDETSPPFAPVQQELRVYENMFDGDESTSFKSYTNNGIKHDLVVEFPQPIDVYGSIEIKAGFHSSSRLGQMLINNIVVLELSAWDSEPEVFSVPFSGQVEEFSIRQKNNAGQACTAVINYINLDGAKLKSNVTATKLVLAQGTDMSKYKVNMRVKQFGGTVTGVIGDVNESNRTLTLTSTASFQASNEILIDQIDGNPISLPELLDTDFLVCTDVNDVTYKVTGDRFKELFGLPARVNQFNINVSEVTTGNAYTLFWDVVDYKSVEITQPNGDVQSFTGKSNLTFTSPGNTGTLTYILNAVGTDGVTVTQSTSVKVVAPPPLPKITNFYKTPSSPTTGNSFTVYWDTEDAVSARLYAGSTTYSTDLSGSYRAVPSVAGSYGYYVEATGVGGDTVTERISFTVSSPPAPALPTWKVTTSPTSINANYFCPLASGDKYNVWTGNCRKIRARTLGGKQFSDYRGSYNNAEITVQTKNKNLIYKGQINKIESFYGDSDLILSTGATNHDKWPTGTDLEVIITGVW
jgi:hypothetical protein